VMVFHYSTRGEDDAYGVYAIDFGRGGERLLFRQGERLNAPRGIAHPEPLSDADRTDASRRRCIHG